MRRFGIGLMVGALLVGCGGPGQRPGAPTRPQTRVDVGGLVDAATIYDRMGLFVTSAPLPMVASLHFLAGRSPDSTLALFAVSLSNHALTFRRQGNEFVADYHVEVVFRSDSGTPSQLVSDQTVRVRSFQETLRADETVLFQGIVTVRPGTYTVSVAIRDRSSPAAARAERTDTVPRFGPGTIADPIAIYQGEGRQGTGVPPTLLVNPRSTVPYGSDTLLFYLEAYGLASGTRLAAEAVDQNDDALWRDTVALGDSAGFARAQVRLAVAKLPVGQQELRLHTLDGAVQIRAPFLLSFSGQWVITNYAQMVSLLRYFDRQDLVAKLHSAPPEQRAQAWHDFWTQTDPDPLTPENEALDEYLRRVQIANFRYQETGQPGWLTDRGEVFITLGPPDEVYEFSGSAVSRGITQVIRWTYNTLRVVLLFQDRAGFGRFDLTPSSRVDYEQALARVRHR